MKTENSEEQSPPDAGRLEKIEGILRDHTNLALILLVSLTLLAGSYYLRLYPVDFNNGETVSWWGIATNLVRGYGYSLCNQYYFPFCTAASSATAMREPAPVLLFAGVAFLFKESLLAAGVTELILLIGIMVTLFFLTREWTGSTTAAFLSAIVWVLYPRSMPLISQVSGDLLAGLGVAFGILFTLRARKSDHIRDWLLAGLGLGIALMSRSAMLVVAVTVMAGLLVERWYLRKNFFQWTRPTLLIFAVVLIIMTPWLIRTKLVFGRALTGSSLVGYNIYRHNYMLGTNNYFHNVGNDEGWAAIQALVARRTDLLGTENEAQMDLVYREEGLKIIAANPVHYVLLSGYRFFMLWFDWRVSEAFGYPMGPTEYATAFLQLLLLILAFIASKNNLQRTWPLWASLALVTLSYMAVNSRLHYLIPVMPLVISLSTAGLAEEIQVMTEDHFQRLARLLDLEAEAEKQETLLSLEKLSPVEAEALGNSLINLVIRKEDSGLGGRILLTFGKRNENLSLPWNRIGNGSPVILSEEGLKDNTSPGWRGIVSRAHKDNIQVAFSQWPETNSDRPTFRLDRSTDEISRQRQRQALESARGAKGTRFAVLRDVLLGKQNSVFDKIEIPIPFNQKLNASQNQAVRFALAAEDVAIIHGPPGTGKTTTLIELMRQIVRNGQTVLAVAASNLAVDNMLERLVNAGENAIRLGHPARVTPAQREHTLDELAEIHPDMRLARKLTSEAHALRKQASKFFRIKPDPTMRQSLRQEAKQLLNEAHQIEDAVTERIISNAKIICATATGLDDEIFKKRRFDWCIMDEASQSVEPSAWIPIQYANRLVLAGDHYQLPPTVISPEAIRGGFNISLMERLLENPKTDISRLLNVQYRMHQDIMNFSSDVFYEGSLQADETIRTALLTGLPQVKSTPLTDSPIHFIDTAGASYDEEQEPDGDSKLNPLEAELVIKKVHELLSCGLTSDQIAIISPYSAQVKYLREKLKSLRLEIDSVDGFQGREKEAVIVSLVRSNREGEVGFLADTRRMNVALTRARRKLIVIGDSATITSHGFYQRMVEYFEAIGAYHSVWE